MQITVANLWSANYQPWLVSSEPWNTVPIDGSIVSSNPTPSLKYGIKFIASVESLVSSVLTPSLKYGIKFIPDVLSGVITVLTPKKIGTLWERVLKNNTIWEEVGTILWSKNVFPWKSDFFPWSTDRTPISYLNIQKPTTSYQNLSKPATTYTNQQKPQTIYTNINKPQI
jgi:hypothetical protein